MDIMMVYWPAWRYILLYIALCYMRSAIIILINMIGIRYKLALLKLII